MAKKRLTDEEVRREIETLQDSRYVAMARRRQRERQRLYNLRWLEKQGKKIAAEEHGVIVPEQEKEAELFEDFKRYMRNR